MTAWLTAGILFTLIAMGIILVKWGNTRCVGVTPVGTFTFLAILFTSGLDVGLIMFPLTEFSTYADISTNPEYGFTNPLAVEFGFWAFLIWSFYFLTCFYFCIIEPRIGFFEIPAIKVINNLVIIGTCAFTAYLLLSNLSWYLPTLKSDEGTSLVFYGIVLSVIVFAVYSSTDIKYVRKLSLSSTWMFFGLILLMAIGVVFSKEGSLSGLLGTMPLLFGYVENIHRFVFPINAYHEFYLYWWFAWSIMIGQFTARFVGGLRTYQLLLAMMVLPSIPIAIWFTILYYNHLLALESSNLFNRAMVFVGILFVINSLDSLIRLYTDNLDLTVSKYGKPIYMMTNIVALSLLTLLFTANFLQIQWVGAVVIALMFACTVFILMNHIGSIQEIEKNPTCLK